MKPAQDQGNQQSGMETSPLVEELLAVEGFWEKESVFSKSVTGRSKKKKKDDMKLGVEEVMEQRE